MPTGTELTPRSRKSVSAAANDEHHDDAARRRAPSSGSRGRRCWSAILVFGIYPRPAVQGHRPGREGRPVGVRELSVLRLVARPSGAVRVTHARLPRTRARDRPRGGGVRRASLPTCSCRTPKKYFTATLAGLGLLAALIPVFTLAVDDGPARSMFGGGYVVDDFSLVLKALFLLAGYVVVLLSQQYVEDGDYWEGEYYVLLLTSLLGMVMMASSRDLVSIFVALEFLSIPAYMLAAWRKRDAKSNEAGMKYFLLGRVLLGADALRHVACSTARPARRCSPGIGDVPRSATCRRRRRWPSCSCSSASPSRSRPCRSTAGRPTPTKAPRRPITAFLSVASKAAGFVALADAASTSASRAAATSGSRSSA